MLTRFCIVAEVVDKEPTLAWLWTVAVILSVASFGLCRWRRWASFIALAATAIWITILLPELRDPFIGPAIPQELGRSYVIQTYVTAFLPLVFIFLGLYRDGTRPTSGAYLRSR